MSGKELHRAMMCIITTTLLLSSFTYSFSQQPTPTPASPPRQQIEPDQDEVVTVNSNLVQVDAVVLDNRGQQVTNLQASDFEIVEDGRVRTAEYCSYISATGEGSAVPISDNRLSAKEVRRSIIFLVANPLLEIKIIAFNENLPFALPPSQMLLPMVMTDSRASAKVLTRFVDQQMGPYDLAAIRETEAMLGSLAGLTTERSILRRAIERVQDDPRNKKAPKVTIIITGSSPIIQEWVQQNLRVIQMMSNAVDQLEKLPGRRVLVLLSRGMLYGLSLNGTDLVRARMQELIAKANRARVTVYTLNPRGPDTANLWGGGIQDNGGLMTLAKETGGRAIFNTNDLTQGFASILEENRGYYLLGYNPGQEIAERPHNVQVRVLRPGLRAQARQTVYAPGRSLRGAGSLPPLIEALNSPLAFREMKLNLTPLFLSPDGKKARLMSLLNINLKNAERVTHEDGSQAINLDVIGRVTAPDGRVVYEKGRKYSLNIPRAEVEQTLAHGIDYLFGLDANAPGDYQVSVAVRDANSGRLGNVTQFIEVADLSRDSLSTSSLLLSTALDDATAIPQPSLNQEILTAFSRREFPVGRVLRYQCYVYNARRDKSSLASNLRVQVTIKRDGETLAMTPQRTFSQTGAPIFVGGDITLGDLSPGDYTLQVLITDLHSRTARTVVTSRFQITKG
jgi:VWFA-related protein